MARKTFDELVDEMAAEERAAQAETQETTETVSEPPKDWAQEPPADWSKPEDKKADEPPKEEVEDKPAEEPKPEAEAPKADPIIDEIETTNTTIRKRLEKQAKSYEQKLADKDAEWQKKLDELKAQFEQKKPEVKTRADFQYDEEYIKYLNQKDVNEILDARDRAKAEKEAAEAAENAKKKAEEEAAAEELKSRQNRFLNNIDQCFDGDAKTTLLKRIQYANSKGLGELLDANPAASDYLLSSPKGPIVLAKLLDASQPEYFRRVFPVGGISPLEQFAELKDIERTAMAERNGQPSVQTTAAPAAPRPKLGKPGAQGSGGTAGDPMVDPKARRDYVRKVMGY